MKNLDKVELVRNKCGVSYEEAKAALENNGYDVLEAVIELEKAGKMAQASNPNHEEASDNERSTGQPEGIGAKVDGACSRFVKRFKALIEAGMERTFVAERNGRQAFTLPVLFVILGMLAWGATLWLLIIGLFFGFRYRIEGTSAVVADINGAMEKAADIAEDVKQSVS